MNDRAVIRDRSDRGLRLISLETAWLQARAVLTAIARRK